MFALIFHSFSTGGGRGGRGGSGCSCHRKASEGTREFIQQERDPDTARALCGYHGAGMYMATGVLVSVTPQQTTRDPRRPGHFNRLHSFTF